MGAVSSKQGAGPTVKAGGRHSLLPQDTVPYQGPTLEVLLVSVPVQMSSHFVSGFSAGATAVTSNVDTYYPMIAGYIAQGYNLVTFYRVPGASSMSGFGAATVAFEAVFCRPRQPQHPTTATNCQLRVEKATMHVQQSYGGILTANVVHGSVADTSDIMSKIYQSSARGERLICVEINGQVVTQGMSAAMAGIGSGMGVDVLFEVPPQPTPARYVYQVINVPIGISVQIGIPARVQVVCDWFGVLASHLNQGWKLVEIFLDQSQQRAGGFASTAGSMNSVWFFEKEAARQHDPTPLYEGTVIEYYHKVSMGFGGTRVKTDWSGVLTEMGQRGWELACIQETPEAIHSGFGKVEMKLMMFFQRPIVSSQPAGMGVVPPPMYPGLQMQQGAPPPAYQPGYAQPPGQPYPTQAIPPATNTTPQPNNPAQNEHKTPL